MVVAAPADPLVQIHFFNRRLHHARLCNRLQYCIATYNFAYHHYLVTKPGR